MYKKYKKQKHKIIILFTSLFVIIALILSLQFNRNTMIVESVLKDVTIFLNKVVMVPFTTLNKEKNHTQSESYIIQKNVNESLEKEIKELKEALELNKTLTEYEPINATILSRNKSYWFNNLTIDKGKKDGIKVGMAVITKNGLVGKISKTSNSSSEIKLITSDDVNYKVSVAIKTNDKDNYAILNGYDKKTGLIKVTGIDKTTIVEKKDTVETSGLGGMFPRGIYIGKVEKIESDKYNLSKNLYIKTQQDFNNIHYVTILKEKN